MTSATEILRRMLDERGVEWWQKKRHTCWKVSKGQEVEMWRAWEAPDGSLTLKVDYIYGLTPEQAIAATLGATDARPTQAESSGTCHVESSIIDTYEYNRWEYELSCGHTIIWEDSEPPRYCPECGRRIEQ